METTKIGIGSISFNGFKMGNFYIHFALNVMKGNVWKNLKLKQTSSEDSIHPHFKKRNNIFFPVGFKSQYSNFQALPFSTQSTRVHMKAHIHLKKSNSQEPTRIKIA